jgi:hypothetical protein
MVRDFAFRFLPELEDDRIFRRGPDPHGNRKLAHPLAQQQKLPVQLPAISTIFSKRDNC